MKTIYDFTIELLRKGPSHNQLLSPLTEYTALCAQHQAKVVHVPYEHWEFLDQLDALRYKQPSRRNVALLKTAQDMAVFLGGIPGLGHEMTRAQCTDQDLTNLRLIVSAAELALLPFEMALTPKDCPGEGGSLLLQESMPVCLTREVRRPGTKRVDWTRKPRILFAAASPPKIGQVPLAYHLKALRRAIDPWVEPYDASKPEERAEKVGKLLTVLPQATIEEIQEACEDGSYTHVHLLAHGIDYGDDDRGQGQRYGLALHDTANKAAVHIVPGKQLGTALHTGACRPLVVTVASCDSANVGTVLTPGASLAHELHVAGIPLVVASQFPLTFTGSVLMTQAFYGMILKGIDPRVALHHLRGRLYARETDRHDWASIVAYAEIPDDFAEQWHRFYYTQTLDAAKVAIKGARWQIEHRQKELQDNDALLEQWLGRLDDGLQELPDLEGDVTESMGMRGSLEKQKAELLMLAARDRDDAQAERYRKRSEAAFDSALAHYRNAFYGNLSSHWTGIQYLALSAVVHKKVPYDLWIVVRVAAEEDDDVWALGTLAELYMLGVLLDKKRVVTRQEAREKAVACAAQILARAGRDSFEVFATWRQFKRYLDWWGTDLPAIRPIAEDVVALLNPEG